MEGGQKREPEKEKAEGDTFWMITIFLGIIQKHRQSKDGKGT